MAKRRTSQVFVEITSSTLHTSTKTQKHEERHSLSRKRSIVEVVISSTPPKAKRLKTTSVEERGHTPLSAHGEGIDDNYGKLRSGEIPSKHKAQSDERTTETQSRQLLKPVTSSTERVGTEARPKSKLPRTASTRSENTSPLEETALDTRDASKEASSKAKSKQSPAERIYVGANTVKQPSSQKQVTKPKPKQATSQPVHDKPAATVSKSKAPKLTAVIPQTSTINEPKPLRPVPKKPKQMQGPYPTPGTSRTGSPSLPPVLPPIIRPRPPQPTFIPLVPRIGYTTLLDRLFVREFILRFKDTMNVISRANMLEIMHMVKGGLHVNPEQPQDMDDEQEDWISPQALKSMFISVLGLFTAEGEAGNDVIRAALKDLRSSGNNLNKIWSILSNMRATLSSAHALIDTKEADSHTDVSPADDDDDDWSVLTFPDPLPPPPNAPLPTATRSTKSNSEDSIQIVDAAQFIPPLIGIMNEALSTARCRQALENGAEDIKSIREPLREKNKAFNEQKKALEAEVADLGDSEDVAAKRDEILSKLKTLKAEHKVKADRLEQERDVWVYTCQPRFNGQLGRDEDGREYWVLTPTPFFFQSKSKTKNENIPKPMVLVWGKQDNEDDARWYAFDEPTVVKKLIAWLGPGGEGRKVNEELVSGLKSYHKIMEATKALSTIP